jgi:hypothetical protein
MEKWNRRVDAFMWVLKAFFFLNICGYAYAYYWIVEQL